METKATQRTEPGSRPPASALEPRSVHSATFFRGLFLVGDTSECHSPGLPSGCMKGDSTDSDSRWLCDGLLLVIGAPLQTFTS